MPTTIRLAFRNLRHHPAFALTAITALALGIGATTAIFSIVDGVLLRPAPFAAIDRLAMVWETDRKSGTSHEPASVPDFFDYRRDTTRFTQLAAFAPSELTLSSAGTGVGGDAGRGGPGAEPTRLVALEVTRDLLSMVGIRPLIGGGFSGDDRPAGGDGADSAGADSGNGAGPGDDRVVQISEHLWTERFARDPSIIGRRLVLDDEPYTVVGVAPASAAFGILQILGAADYARAFADRGGQPRIDAWIPLSAGTRRAPRATHGLFMVGRLAPGHDVAQAQQEMTGLSAALERAYRENTARGVLVEPMSHVIFGRVRPSLLALLGAVALVLLVACANVANLLLARGMTRAREVALRAALGASARRLAAQFLAESLVLVAIAAVLGIALAFAGVELLRALAPADIPRVTEVRVDGRVLLVTTVVSVLAALAFGLVPIAQARRVAPQEALKQEAGRHASMGRAQRRAQDALVIAELALALVLMAGAGLLINTLWRLSQVSPGFQAARLLKAEYQLPASRYPRRFDEQAWQPTRRFDDALVARLRALPGVRDAALAANHPLDPGFTSSFMVLGREAEAQDWPEIIIRRAGLGYFRTLGVPLRLGRLPDARDDRETAFTLVINEAARARFFASRDPLGQRLRLWGRVWTIVGVVGDERLHGLSAAAPPAVYLPLAKAPSWTGSLLVRADDGVAPAALEEAVRRAVREIDAGVVLFGAEPMTETVRGSVAQRRFLLLVLGLFAIVGLALAAIGVYGLLTYTVAQRTREIGIRMALGADRRHVVRAIVRHGATLAAIGLTLGAAGALAATRLLASLLYGVTPADPLTLAAVALLLALVTLGAAWLPSRRAARVDPLAALRAE